MPIFKPRTRVVYFRISEDEFCQLSRLCEARGARSLSDMARAAMQNLLHQTDDEDTPVGFGNRLAALERILSELNETLRAVLANGPVGANGKEDCSDQVV